MLYLFLNLLTPIQHVGQQCQPFIIHHSDKKIRENKNNINKYDYAQQPTTQLNIHNTKLVYLPKKLPQKESQQYINEFG